MSQLKITIVQQAEKSEMLLQIQGKIGHFTHLQRENWPLFARKSSISAHFSGRSLWTMDIYAIASGRARRENY